MEFTYTATKNPSTGRFSATLYADGKNVASKDGLREGAVQGWAEVEAIAFKQDSLAAPVHTEIHTKHGQFEL